jgi:hypothetical protein
LLADDPDPLVESFGAEPELYHPCAGGSRRGCLPVIVIEMSTWRQTRLAGGPGDGPGGHGPAAGLADS